MRVCLCMFMCSMCARGLCEAAITVESVSFRIKIKNWHTYIDYYILITGWQCALCFVFVQRTSVGYMSFRWCQCVLCCSSWWRRDWIYDRSVLGTAAPNPRRASSFVGYDRSITTLGSLQQLLYDLHSIIYIISPSIGTHPVVHELTCTHTQTHIHKNTSTLWSRGWRGTRTLMNTSSLCAHAYFFVSYVGC